MHVAEVLADAGWAARQVHIVPQPTSKGLTIGAIGGEKQAAQRASQLISAFRAAGIQTGQEDAQSVGGVSTELVAVLIGPNPDK